MPDGGAHPGPGLFISVEGVDGAGKSTQVAALAGSLRRARLDVVVVREPGGTEAGELVRDLVLHQRFAARLDPWAEALLMVCARVQLIAEVIRPALARGAVVVADRFVDSTLAYQGGGRGLDIEALRRLHADACGGLWPQLTVLLELPLDRAAGRRHEVVLPLDRMETDLDDRGFSQRVAQTFSAIADAEPDRVARVDATRSAVEVSSAVWELVAPRLPSLDLAGARS